MPVQKINQLQNNKNTVYGAKSSNEIRFNPSIMNDSVSFGAKTIKPNTATEATKQVFSRFSRVFTAAQESQIAKVYECMYSSGHKVGLDYKQLYEEEKEIFESFISDFSVGLPNSKNPASAPEFYVELIEDGRFALRTHDWGENTRRSVIFSPDEDTMTIVKEKHKSSFLGFGSYVWKKIGTESHDTVERIQSLNQEVVGKLNRLMKHVLGNDEDIAIKYRYSHD